jgi:hypothetical protein
MRTKTLLLAAAALATSLVISQAQVYSGVVGYVSLALPTNGYTAVTVPLDYDGTGANDYVTNIFGTNVPNGTAILAWNTAGGGFATANIFGPTSKNPTPHWTTPGAIYQPGEGIFIQNTNGVATNVVVVGTVLQGGLTNSYISQAGYSFVGGQFPVTGGITSTFGYVPSLGDSFLAWSTAGNGYLTANIWTTTSKNPTPHWSGGSEPQIVPGQAVFIQTTNAHPVWGTNFVVQ